ERVAWMKRDFPQLEEWHGLVVEWLDNRKKDNSQLTQYFSHFFRQYVIKLDLPVELKTFFSASIEFPSFYEIVCANSKSFRHSVRLNNTIHGFLQFVLAARFAHRNGDGDLVVDPAYRNPIPRRNNKTGQI